MSGYTINWAKGALPDPFGNFIEGRGEGLKQMLQYMQLLKAMRSMGGGGGGGGRSRGGGGGGGGGRSRGGGGGGGRSRSGREPVRRVAPGTPTGGRENPFADPSTRDPATRGPEYSTSGRGDPQVAAAPTRIPPGVSFGPAPPGVVPTRGLTALPPVAYPAMDRNTPVAPSTAAPAAPAWQDDGTVEPVEPPRYYDDRGQPLPGPQGTAPPAQRGSLDDANIYGSLATDNPFGPPANGEQVANFADTADPFEFEPGDLAKMAEDMAAMTALQDQEQLREEQQQYRADVEAIEQSMDAQQESYQDDPFEEPEPDPEPEDPFEDDGE